MSFRNRLTFFFILLVILPVLAVGLVAFLTLRSIEEGKLDAGLDQAQIAALGLYDQSQGRAEVVARTVSMDEELAAAVRDGDRAALEERLENLRQRGGADHVRLTPNGQAPIDVGKPDTIAPATGRVVDANGQTAGRLSLSVSTAKEFARLLKDVTNLEVILTQDGEVVATTLEWRAAGEPCRLRARAR